MRCGIDASNLISGGGSNHIRNVLRNWSCDHSDIDSLVIWASKELCATLPKHKGINLITVPEINTTSSNRFLWQINKLPRIAENECDVFFAPGGIAGRHTVPLISMCRNMLPFTLKESFRYGISYMLLRLMYLRILQSRTFSNSSGIIFLCQYALDRVINQIGDAQCKMALIPHGVEYRFFGESRSQLNKESFDIDNPFRLLYVSIVDVYKHQWNVVEAVAKLRREDIPIVLDIVGPAYDPAMRRLEGALNEFDPDRVLVNYLGNIPHDDLHHVLSDADGFVFASTCENFPNTLLEAMASGLPVASSNFRPMTDILGEDAFYFDPINIQSIADSIKQMLGDHHRRHQISQSVKSSASRYTWEKCAMKTFKFIGDVKRSN